MIARVAIVLLAAPVVAAVLTALALGDLCSTTIPWILHGPSLWRHPTHGASGCSFR